MRVARSVRTTLADETEGALAAAGAGVPRTAASKLAEGPAGSVSWSSPIVVDGSSKQMLAGRFSRSELQGVSAEVIRDPRHVER